MSRAWTYEEIAEACHSAVAAVLPDAQQGPWDGLTMDEQEELVAMVAAVQEGVPAGPANTRTRLVEAIARVLLMEGIPA